MWYIYTSSDESECFSWKVHGGDYYPLFASSLWLRCRVKSGSWSLGNKLLFGLGGGQGSLPSSSLLL